MSALDNEERLAHSKRPLVKRSAELVSKSHSTRMVNKLSSFPGGKGPSPHPGCILFLNGLQSLKPVAEVVGLCEHPNQLSDALTKPTAAATRSHAQPGRQTPAETEQLKWL